MLANGRVCIIRPCSQSIETPRDWPGDLFPWPRRTRRDLCVLFPISPILPKEASDWAGPSPFVTLGRTDQSEESLMQEGRGLAPLAPSWLGMLLAEPQLVSVGEGANQELAHGGVGAPHWIQPCDS